MILGRPWMTWIMNEDANKLSFSVDADINYHPIRDNKK
jgi:hypothetical protein